MTTLPSEIVEIEPVRVHSEEAILEAVEQRETATRLSKATKTSLLILAILLPIPFGAVHNGIYLPVSAFIFALAAAHLLVSRQTIDLSFAAGSASRGAMKLILLFLAYIAAQTLCLAFISEPHPVLDSASSILRTAQLWSGISMFVFFGCVYFLARLVLKRDTFFQRKLVTAVLFSGVVVSLIGLSHWFYDNGKLFWIFEPDHIFVSERARWPFVNANHLGHFLLPIFFLFIAKLGDELELVSDYQRRNQKNDRQTLSNFAHSSRLQGRLVKTSFVFCFLLAVLLAIFGTLSRGTWFGVSVAILLYFFFSRGNTPREHAVRKASEPPKRGHYSTSSRKRRGAFSIDAAMGYVKRAARPAILFVAALFLIFFLSERGSDLVVARIDYGLTASKDDMRWQMYSDTLPMIAENPILGVGMGGWRAEYPRFMAPELAGMEPVYLHSEPLQLVAEFGLLGTSIILALVLYAARRSFAALPRLRAKEPAKARRLTALICGLTGFFAASFFDFPLRMPAIVFLLGICLALMMFYADLGLAEE